jgi:hypothetical protein
VLGTRRRSTLPPWVRVQIVGLQLARHPCSAMLCLTECEVRFVAGDSTAVNLLDTMSRRVPVTCRYTFRRVRLCSRLQRRVVRRELRFGSLRLSACFSLRLLFHLGDTGVTSIKTSDHFDLHGITTQKTAFSKGTAVRTSDPASTSGPLVTLPV